MIGIVESYCFQIVYVQQTKIKRNKPLTDCIYRALTE